MEPLSLLLVEDSDDDVELLLYELESEGIEIALTRVVYRSELYEALEEGTFDVAITDDGLPDLCSLDVLSILKAEIPRLPVVVVSGSLGEDAAVKAMRCGAADYVLKHDLRRIGVVVRREGLRNRAQRAQTHERERNTSYHREVLMALPQLVVRTDEEGVVIDLFGGGSLGWRPTLGEALSEQLSADPADLSAAIPTPAWQTTLSSGEQIVIFFEDPRG